MKNHIKIILIIVLWVVSSGPLFSSNGPQDPGGTGNGILGFGFGPGIPYYGGSGFGPAILLHYDQSIWRAGPGSISLGGQFGVSFFWHNYIHGPYQYREGWTDLGFDFRGAYHYGWTVPGLDTYAGFGLGTVFSMYHDNGSFTGRRASWVGFMPTGFVGGTYFFSDVVGVNAEFGFNFAYIEIGLDFRIVK